MNFEVREEFDLSEDIRNIERKFYRFYLKVIKDYFDLDKNFLWPGRVTPNYGKQNHNKNNFRVFNDPGELLLLCIQDTCLSLRKFFNLLGEYVEFTKYLSKRNLITIYCASCESLFSAFGLCTVIDKAIEQYGFSHNINTKKIELVVIDKRENWINLCNYITKSVNSCYKNVEIQLEVTDERSSRSTYEAVGTRKEVDIVVIARYLSRFPYMKIRAHFLQVILNRMKELSILFYMDENYEIYYNTLKHLISKTDNLVEIMNKETVYESPDDFENTEYYSEFQFLRNTVFKRVMFSTCIKCCGIKDNTSVKEGNEDASSLSESRRRTKQKILKRFKKENSSVLQLDTLEAKYLTTKSKSFSSIPIQKTCPKMTSEIKNATKSSKMYHNSNVSPSSSQITTMSKKYDVKHSKQGINVSLPTSVSTRESREKNERKSEISKESKMFEKLRNTYKYLEEYKNTNAETVQTNKAYDKLSSTNPLNKINNYPGEEKKTNHGTVQTNKIINKSTFTNNECKYSGERRKPNAESVKSGEIIEKLVFTNPQNKCKYSREISKPNAETIQRKKSIDKLALTNPQNKCKYSGEGRKMCAETVQKNKSLDKVDSTNPPNKYKYSGKGKKTKAETTVKSSKVIETLTAANQRNNNKQPKPNKQNVVTVKSNEVSGKSVTANKRIKNKHSKSNKADTKTIKRSKIVGMLVTMNLRSKSTYFEEEISSNTDNLKASGSVQKSTSTELDNKNGCKSPHLMSEKSLSEYVNHLSDIYYTKHFDK